MHLSTVTEFMHLCNPWFMYIFMLYIRENEKTIKYDKFAVNNFQNFSLYSTDTLSGSVKKIYKFC